MIRDALEKRSRECPAVPVMARSFSSSKKRRAEDELDPEEPEKDSERLEPAAAEQERQETTREPPKTVAGKAVPLATDDEVSVLPLNEAAEFDELDASSTARREQAKETVVASPARAE